MLIAVGIGATFAPIKLLGKTFGKHLVKKLAYTVSTKYALKFVGIVAGLTGLAINIGTTTIMNSITDYFWSFTSLGGIIAFIFDQRDGEVDGRISW